MTLREAIANSFGQTVPQPQQKIQEPDQQTIGKNLKSLDNIKNGLDENKKKELEAIAAELKAHQAAAAQKDLNAKKQQQMNQLKTPQTKQETVAQQGNNPNLIQNTAQADQSGETAQIK